MQVLVIHTLAYILKTFNLLSVLGLTKNSSISASPASVVYVNGPDMTDISDQVHFGQFYQTYNWV